MSLGCFFSGLFLCAYYSIFIVACELPLRGRGSAVTLAPLKGEFRSGMPGRFQNGKRLGDSNDGPRSLSVAIGKGLLCNCCVPEQMRELR